MSRVANTEGLWAAQNNGYFAVTHMACTMIHAHNTSLSGDARCFKMNLSECIRQSW